VRASARNLRALPTILVLVVVLTAGARLIYLSVLEHSARARATAETVLAASAKRVETSLQDVFGRAARTARSGAAASDPAQLDKQAFLMSADEGVLAAREAEAPIAKGIADEWKSAQTGRPTPAAAILGPMRLGSQWLIAARIPVTPANSPAPAYAVAYTDLDTVIAGARLSRLAAQGYDFEVSQMEPRSAFPRTFVSSSSAQVPDTVTTRIALPADPAVPGSYLRLAIRPRAGWFPSGLLESEIAVLVFLAWLFAFGTHDLTHALDRARSALATARRRLHASHQQLAEEIQKRLDLQESFEHARYHDMFTGLHNRRHFMDELDRSLREVRRRRLRRLAVIIVDISRLTLINHMLGHTAGDDLMVQVARRLEEITSSLDGSLARWSGDQFAVLLLDVDSADAALAVANRFQEQLRPPFHLRRYQLNVAATLGVTCIDSGQERAEDIVREADIALSVAKTRETTQAVLYAPHMRGRSSGLVSLDADLHVALQKHQLRLLYQPIVDLSTRKMVGAEALLRWQHPVEGLLSPNRFLRSAEEAGLMAPITRWIVQTVTGVAAEWRRHLPANQKFYVSVNLSPSVLRDPGFGDYVAATLKQRTLPPSYLKFELTEMALGNVAGARECLERLHGMGIQLVLDDFGTGYSSLSNLQLFPFDLVKIDCPFVDRRGVFQSNMSMVAAMIQLASSLDLTTVAEIIDSEAAAAALKAMGCRYGQGYYFSPPLESAAAYEKLRGQESLEPLPGSQTPPVRTVVDKSTSQTLVMRRLQDPSEQATSETVIVRAAQDPSSSETVIVRAPQDSSATIVLSTEDIDFGDDEDDQEEEEDE
jgi:diguanylate cyclase (GGDEF)-like protein